MMHLTYPPKFCISIVCNFSWDGCNTKEKGGGEGGANKMPYGRCASGLYKVSYLVLLCLKICNTFIDLSTHQVEENPENDRLNVNVARTYES